MRRALHSRLRTWRSRPPACRAPPKAPTSRPAPRGATPRRAAALRRRARAPVAPGRWIRRGAAGFQLTPQEAIGVAAGTDAAREERIWFDARAYTQGPCRWQVSFYEGSDEVARVAIDDRTGHRARGLGRAQVGTELPAATRARSPRW